MYSLITNSKKGILILSMLLMGVLTSCGDSGTDGRNIDIPGVDGPYVVLNDDDVLISMVFESLPLEGGLRYNIPKYPNSFVEVAPDFQSDGTLLSFSIALKDVFDDSLDSLDPQTLPGGRPLPGVRDGRLPAVAFSIENFYGVGVYIGPSVFGLFVPFNTGFDTAVITARFYTDGVRTGNISLVGKDDEGKNSGLLLMLDLGSKTTRLLKQVADI